MVAEEKKKITFWRAPSIVKAKSVGIVAQWIKLWFDSLVAKVQFIANGEPDHAAETYTRFHELDAY